LYDIKEVHFLF